MSAVAQMPVQVPSGVRLDHVVKSFGSVDVLKGIDLDIEGGEFVVFVGPSGCGKSTLLRLIAGLEEVSDGAIAIGGRDVTDADPSRRGIAMVFQSYALYPHMTVGENMGFGLRMAGRPKDEIAGKMNRAAAILHLTPLLDRRPAQLSGGQRQRVAIGRAIVRDPEVFLFDEPLSNLDAELRVEMRIEIAKLHRALGNTMIYVTHDQTEAMTLADKIVVLRDGRIEQVGSPAQLYNDPDNLFVAGFIGSPKMNFLKGRVTSDGVAVGDTALPLPNLTHPPAMGDAVTVGLRPEDLAPSSDGSLPFTLDFVEYLGGTSWGYGQIANSVPLVAHVDTSINTEDRTALRLGFNLSKLHVFNSEGRRLR